MKLRIKKIKTELGFTLVEMLVVILIVGILLGIGAVAVRDLRGGKGVNSAVTTLETLADEARTVAMSRGVNARLVIHDNANEPERFRRYLAVAVGIDANQDGQPDEWRIENRGTLLPDGVYFSADYSALVGERLRPASMNIDFSGGGNGTPQNCFYYEFNPEGILVNPPGGGAGLVIFKGNFSPGSTEPRPVPQTNGAPDDVSGIVIWKQGNSSRIQNRSQIQF